MILFKINMHRNSIFKYILYYEFINLLKAFNYSELFYELKYKENSSEHVCNTKDNQNI